MKKLFVTQSPLIGEYMQLLFMLLVLYTINSFRFMGTWLNRTPQNLNVGGRMGVCSHVC
jgi:hypothetical protein